MTLYMKALCAIALLAVMTGCSTTKPANPDLRQYDWTESPNFSDLRKRFGWSDEFRQRCEILRPLKPMAEKMESEYWEEAASIGQAWLAQCPVDIRVHYYTGIALAESGRKIESEHHFRWARGLMESLVSSGDGKSPETAYETISIPEEYDALYFFGLEKKSQALITEPLMCDLLTATNEAGEEISIYFNPAAHFSRLHKMLE